MEDETVIPNAFGRTLLNCLIADAARLTSLELSRDLEYLLKRYAEEGESFLFTTLPLLGKAVEQSLISEGPLKVPPNFQIYGKTRLPVFLHSLFKACWTPDGALLTVLPTKEQITCIGVIRQVTLFFSKVIVSKKEMEAQALSTFLERVTAPVTLESNPAFPCAREILRTVFSQQNPLTAPLLRFRKDPFGRHSNGAVEGGEKGHEKWLFNRVPGVPAALFKVNSALCVPVGGSKPGYSRVSTVPKDFRGPRVICVEPKELQFAQQGLMELLYNHLARHPISRVAIDFTDVQRSRAACFNDKLATIDLKDASDHLSLAFARWVLPRWLFQLATRYRSRKVRIGEKTWSYTSLATMGSSTCFPLQTVIFFAIALGCIWSWNRSHIPSERITPFVRVYGDDIIIPRAIAGHVMKALTDAGLKVNTTKTCIHTLVKESCGEYVVGGVSQVIVRPKVLNAKSTSSWRALLDTIPLFKAAGYHACAEACADVCRDRYPIIPCRYNKGLQRLEYRVPVQVGAGSRAVCDGAVGLYAYFTRQDTTPFQHGSRLVVKRRWVPMHPYAFMA